MTLQPAQSLQSAGIRRTGATSATFVPMEASAYYLVVPQNAAAEGSYGTSTGGFERGPGAASCLPQAIIDCR